MKKIYNYRMVKKFIKIHKNDWINTHINIWQVYPIGYFGYRTQREKRKEFKVTMKNHGY